MTVGDQRRLVTFESEAYFLPCRQEQPHICVLQLANVDAGRFKLRVNGEETAIISKGNTNTALRTNVQTALDNKFSGEFTSTVNMGNPKITSTSNKFYRFEILSEMGRTVDYRYFLTGVTSGNYKLSVEVDGVAEDTANIAYNAGAGAVATALNGITGVPSGTFSVTGSATNGYRITTDTAQDWVIGINQPNNGSISGFYHQRGAAPSAVDPNETRVVIEQQGSSAVNLSADVMSMKFGTKVKTTETAGLSELEDYPVTVGTSGTFSLSMYGTVVGDWIIPLSTEGLEGTVYWFPRGYVVGRTYSAMNVVLDGFDEDLPFHEKVEISISGTRQGRMLAPKGTIIPNLNIV